MCALFAFSSCSPSTHVLTHLIFFFSTGSIRAPRSSLYDFCFSDPPLSLRAVLALLFVSLIVWSGPMTRIRLTLSCANLSPAVRRRGRNDRGTTDEAARHSARRRAGGLGRFWSCFVRENESRPIAPRPCRGRAREVALTRSSAALCIRQGKPSRVLMHAI